MSITRKCIVNDCKDRLLAKGYCTKHYQRVKKYGYLKHIPQRDPRPATIKGDIAKIPLGVNAKDGYAVADISMAYLSDRNWTLSNTGYATSRLGMMQHLVIGKPKKGFFVDHKNQDKLDNRTENLRFATRSQNGSNIIIKSHNTSGYKGVIKREQQNNTKWIARITINGDKQYLGIYDTKEQAALAYNKKAKELFGEFAYLNNID